MAGRPAAYMSSLEPIRWDLLANAGNNMADSYDRGQAAARAEAHEQLQGALMIARFKACMAERGYILKPVS
jgi:hypothetical protein